jgi:anti-sigma regulatory factor (Ser/Thr protein kinase)
MIELRGQYRGTPRFVREAREAVVDYARRCGFSSQLTIDIALGVGEALANAVEHGNKDLGFINVACSFQDGELAIEVSDEGAGFDIGRISTQRRQADAVRGFGISIMRSVMDSVEFEHSGAVVRLCKRLPPGAAVSGASA